MTLKVSLLRFLQKGIFASCALMFAIVAPAFAQGVSIKSFGHSALLIKGGGRSILLNPFKSVGCAQGLAEPKMKVDFIFASSELADEGAKTSEGVFFVQPGSYLIDEFKIEGFSVPHDRIGGRQYGFSTVWKWSQGGLKFAHLGGSAGPLSLEDKLLLGRPDVLIIAVGGGKKVYNGTEAAELVNSLKPKIIIPVQYVSGETPDNCDQTNIQPFLEAMNETKVRKVGKNFRLSTTMPSQRIIHVMY